MRSQTSQESYRMYLTVRVLNGLFARRAGTTRQTVVKLTTSLC